MKRFLILLLTLTMLLSLCPAALAATVTTDEASGTLVALGLLTGTDDGLDLNRAPTRNEILVMLIRLLGQEDEAKAYTAPTTFLDVTGTWAEPYVSYAQAKSLVNGISDTQFGGSSTASVRDYLTLILRALGYEDGTDFTWNNSIAFSDKIGLTHGEYSEASAFLREDMVLISYTALTLKIKGSDKALIDKLYEEGAVSYSQLVSTRLAGHVNTSKTALSAGEIYERCSSSVFTINLYESEESYTSGEADGTASGFFVTSDGVAVMSYHALDGMRYATITTTDGHIYPLDSVLYYDTFRDIAVARISRYSFDGSYATYFPYIEIGDSDAISAGDTVYAIGSPIGLSDTFSSGMISTKSRIVDDPLYPCIQLTAPISQGSSGGVVLNEYGKAIGVVYAMYASGNNLNLCVPINSISGISFTGEGMALSDICDNINELKESSTITASKTDVKLKVDESVELTISANCPVTFAAKFHINGDSVSCAWGDFTSKTSTILKITGREAGKSEVVISFADDVGNEDFELVINVTVTE